MNASEIIKRKRDGKLLSADEIKFMVDGYVREDISDYQMSAFLMACFIRGLSDNETMALTKAMIESGDTYSFDDIDGIKVDKHSTGGVGDKISIPLAPILASLDFYVPMVSGRGLGHTGGTLDKLESIEGFNVNLGREKFRSLLKKNKAVMGGQTERFVPADKKIYALRDVTGTVESIPLITASIMSKKLAEGIDSLFLDVKTGSGAFMKKKEDAETLAERMYALGSMMGKRMAYIISDMSEPLGDFSGNGCEILESVEILKGERKNSASELVKKIVCMILKMHSIGKSHEERSKMYDKVVNSGSAYEKFLKIASSQNSNIKSITKAKLMHDKVFEIKAEKSGFINDFDSYSVGIALIYMKAGRFKKEDKIDHKAGIELLKRIGDEVKKGDPIFRVYAEKFPAESEVLLKKSAVVSEKKPNVKKLIVKSRGV